jgi:Flp pilus assembly protein TadD
MASNRMVRADEARQAIDAAARSIDHWTAERYGVDDGDWVIHQGATAVWPVSWQDWLELHLRYNEARLLLGLPPQPEDPRSHVLRARAFAGLRRRKEAVAEFANALALTPSDPGIRVPFHHSQAFYYGERGDWSQAAAEFAQASALLPSEPYLLMFQGIAHLAGRDVEAYRRVCAEMLQRFETTRDHRAAGSLAELCTIVPDALPDPTRVLPAALVARDWYPGASRLHGAVLYRCGDYAQSIEVLQAAAKLHRPTAGDLCFLSMAHHRLGQTDAARRSLALAQVWLEMADRQGPEDLRGTRPAWGRWDQQIVFPLLRRKAETTIGRTIVN